MSYEEAMGLIDQMRNHFGDSAVFGREKDESLHSSLNAVMQGFGGKDLYPSVEEKAAHLLYFLVKNHSFVDGNKRIAFAAADVFLRINGWRLQRAPMQIYAEMMQMFESGTFDIAHLDPWLRSFAVAAE